MRLYTPMPPRQQNHMNKAGPTASPTLLVPNLCTLNKTIRKATEIITTSSATNTEPENRLSTSMPRII